MSAYSSSLKETLNPIKFIRLSGSKKCHFTIVP